MGGWLIWLLLGGLFLFLMFRGGGCCGRHGSHGGRPGGAGSEGKDRPDDHGRHSEGESETRASSSQL